MSSLIPPKVRIGDICQIGIVVRDVTAAVKRYWTTLGVGPWQIHRVGPPILRDVTVRGTPVVISGRCALAQSGPVQVELIEPPEGPSIYQEFLETKGEGLHHVQSRVEDPDGLLAAFHERGVDILMSGRIGDTVFYYMDTEPLLGFIYEFVKRGSAPPRSLGTFEGTFPP